MLKKTIIVTTIDTVADISKKNSCRHAFYGIHDFSDSVPVYKLRTFS